MNFGAQSQDQEMQYPTEDSRGWCKLMKKWLLEVWIKQWPMQSEMEMPEFPEKIEEKENK